MKLEYSLDKNDILENHLYIISKMKQFNKDKKELFIGITGIFTLIGIIELFKEKYFPFFIFSTIIFLFIIFHKKVISNYYKFFTNWKVKRLIKMFPNNIGIKTLEINENGIIANQKGITIAIDLAEINSINEIKEYLFIRIKNKTNVIIPKGKITSNNVEEVSQFLKQLSENLNIEYIKELDWKW